MDVLTPEQRSRCMSRIKSKNTSIEISFCKALWHEGIRYRKNYVKLPGKPDIAITKYKIAIFCDGEFWHGKDWRLQKQKLQTRRDFWIAKIERNIDRDNETDIKLWQMGWVVLHFWGKEIQKNLESCVKEVKETIVEVMADNYNDKYENYYEQNVSDSLLVAESTPLYCP
jgi:DNA mismatch endonuclease (patch repair protein)